jgi:hypothetical protein
VYAVFRILFYLFFLPLLQIFFNFVVKILFFFIFNFFAFVLLLFVNGEVKITSQMCVQPLKPEMSKKRTISHLDKFGTFGNRISPIIRSPVLPIYSHHFK